MRPVARASRLAADRWARLRELLDCPPVIRRSCFAQLLLLLDEWPAHDGREAAFREAGLRLAAWPTEDRVASVEHLVHPGTRLVREVVTLARGIREWYPDDSARDHTAARNALLASPRVRELDHAWFVRATGALPAVLRSRNLERVRDLRTTDSYGPLELPRFAQWPGRPHLERLSLASEYAPDLADLFVALERATRLRELTLYASCHAADVAMLVRHDALLARLERLSLAHNVLRDDAADLLAGARALGGLRELDLRNNAFTERGRRAIREAPQFANTVILFEPSLR